jgi:hypothetical protein
LLGICLLVDSDTTGSGVGAFSMVFSSILGSNE